VADHPLKVPQDLAERLWLESADKSPQCNTFRAHVFAQKIAQWAADQELEAIIHWLITGPYGFSVAANHKNLVHDLRSARRPKPPSLHQQALQLLETYKTSGVMLTADQADTIRRALEALPDE